MNVRIVARNVRSASPVRAGWEREIMRLLSLLTGDRRYIARSWTQTVQPPAGVVPRRALDAQDLRRLPRRERHIEAIERHRKAVAERLDEGFLTRPAVEESQRPVAWVEGAIRRVLAAREIACGDVVGVADHPDGFDVDADRVAEKKRVCGDVI